MFSLESDEMTALWPNDSLTFTFYVIISNIIPNWATFVKEVFWFDVLLTLRKLFSRFQLHRPDFRCTGWGDSCCVSRASSKESWRTFLIPKWSVHHIGCQEDHIKTLGKLCVKFQVSRCTEVPSLHHIKKWTHKDIKT